jgi:tRNA pseudouridine65 synthase
MYGPEFRGFWPALAYMYQAHETVATDMMAVPLSSGVVRLHAADGLAFVHKPSGMETHPQPGAGALGQRKRKVQAGELLCPACQRSFGWDDDKGLSWKRMHAHVTQARNGVHAAWRASNPRHRPEYEEPEPTLWDVLRNLPAGLLFGRDLADAVAAAEAECAAKGRNVPKVRLCNRLDRGTSGIVVVAETAELCDLVQKSWMAHVQKQYLCFVRGCVDGGGFTVDRRLTDREARSGSQPQPQPEPEPEQDLGKAETHGKPLASVPASPPTTRDACTGFEVVGRYLDGDFTLLRASLLRGGRTHQIRRHLDGARHHIVGDKKYGKGRINVWLEKEYGLARIFLHAERLVMAHPVSQEEIVVVDALPADLQEFLGRLASASSAKSDGTMVTR